MLTSSLPAHIQAIMRGEIVAAQVAPAPTAQPVQVAHAQHTKHGAINCAKVIDDIYCDEVESHDISGGDNSLIDLM